MKKKEKRNQTRLKRCIAPAPPLRKRGGQLTRDPLTETRPTIAQPVENRRPSPCCLCALQGPLRAGFPRKSPELALPSFTTCRTVLADFKSIRA